MNYNLSLNIQSKELFGEFFTTSWILGFFRITGYIENEFITIGFQIADFTIEKKGQYYMQ